jgi:N-acetylmuramidase
MTPHISGPSSKLKTAGVTQGFGFRVDRRPQILFERHIFCKRTDGCFDAEAPDVSDPAGGYGTLVEQYTKLERAIALCAKGEIGNRAGAQVNVLGNGPSDGFQSRACGI